MADNQKQPGQLRGNRPADNARQGTPANLPTQLNWQSNGAAGDFLGLNEDAAPAPVAQTRGGALAAQPGDASWLMDGDARPQPVVEPEPEPYEEAPRRQRSADDDTPFAPAVLDASWTESAARTPVRKRPVMTVVAVLAVLATAGFVLMQRGKDSSTELAHAYSSPVATPKSGATTAPGTVTPEAATSAANARPATANRRPVDRSGHVEVAPTPEPAPEETVVVTEMIPEPATITPEPAPTKPAFTPTKPEIAPKKPAFTPTKPEIAPTKPEIATTKPEIAPTKPEIATTKPEIATTKPEIATTKPEIATTKPEVATTKPEVATTKPEIATTKPEIATTKPEVATTKPEIATSKPETVSSKPEPLVAAAVVAPPEPTVAPRPRFKPTEAPARPPEKTPAPAPLIPAPAVVADVKPPAPSPAVVETPAPAPSPVVSGQETTGTPSVRVIASSTVPVGEALNSKPAVDEHRTGMPVAAPTSRAVGAPKETDATEEIGHVRPSAAASREGSIPASDVLLPPAPLSGVRSAMPQDMLTVWNEESVPMDRIDAKQKVMTPNVGEVRVTLNTKDVFEGRLYAVGEGSVWIEGAFGRMGLDHGRIVAVDRIAPVPAPGSTPAKPGTFNLNDRVRLKTAEGYVSGRVSSIEGTIVKIVTDSGLKLSAEAKNVEMVLQAPSVGVKPAAPKN